MLYIYMNLNTSICLGDYIKTWGMLLSCNHLLGIISGLFLGSLILFFKVQLWEMGGRAND